MARLDQRTTWFLAGAAIAAMLVARCGGVLAPSAPQDAAADAPSDAAVVDAFVIDASVLPGPDAAAFPPSPKACDIDGGNKPCPNPPSVCANRDWLVYYENGRCVDGGCVWDTLWLQCQIHDCKQGYCSQFGTN